MAKELSEDTKTLLKQVYDQFSLEDRGPRDRQIRVWRKLKLLWENLQYHYYSEVAHDWRLPVDNSMEGGADQSYYDKPVNVFRAYLESIIAALSVTIPPVTCYPDDADNPLDVSTAKAGDRIAQLIFRHNNAPLLWLHALFIYCTEGMMACYAYPHSDEKYGTYETEETEDYEEIHEKLVCPVCGEEFEDRNPIESDSFMPEEISPTACPQCSQIVTPSLIQRSVPATRLIGITKHPKTRICMDVYGGLYVKVPIGARKQADCPYLIFSYETHYSNVLDRYPSIRNRIQKGGTLSAAKDDEQWGRLSPQYQGDYPNNNVTVHECWFRPSSFNVLLEDDVDELKKEYPRGVKVVIIDDQVVDAEGQELDDYWTICHNPLSDYIHFDPLGLLLTSVQEITNDLVSLTLQTIEHGIPQTFANPKVLDFVAYRSSEVVPGGIYPAVPSSGKPLSEGFYEVKTATLSAEILPFANKVQELGQLISGALPSLFGGQVSGSRTASEYSMSRAQALQRLQTVWKSLTLWWKDVFGKVIPMFINEMKDDERQVQKDEFGNFINVYIRRAELEGKIGNVELEANENLPITWSQQKDVIMQLLEINNELLTGTLGSPENIPYLKRALGLSDYSIPGEDDRQKQYEEIVQLVNSQPYQLPPPPEVIMQAEQMGQQPPPPQEMPSVEIDPDVDMHAIHADICRRWLVSDAGRQTKLENVEGYKNVLLHMKMHKDYDMMMMMQQQMQQMQQQAPGAGQTQEAPIQEEGNVPTAQ